jgi:hypothetical protein
MVLILEVKLCLYRAHRADATTSGAHQRRCGWAVVECGCFFNCNRPTLALSFLRHSAQKRWQSRLQITAGAAAVYSGATTESSEPAATPLVLESARVLLPTLRQVGFYSITKQKDLLHFFTINSIKTYKNLKQRALAAAVFSVDRIESSNGCDKLLVLVLVFFSFAINVPVK